MKALLDACVLFPTILREILTDVAQAGLYTPLWSERILSEWLHAAGRLGEVQAVIAGGEAALMRARFPGAMIAPGDEATLGVSLPDAGDLHVLRTAVDGEADLIVTFNLRDFPRRTLGLYGISALHPDEFLTTLAKSQGAVVEAAVEAARARAIAAGGDLTRRAMLARSGLPRLNKFLTQNSAKIDETVVSGRRG
ncbi:RSP_2648 family PIN domain-containing protein [Paracoccus aminophilus]|uniref:PIN domain-containing protein n=1 Tax=Paracoccus aminophilus JCM 7686 TaxID=1367847 RepID=S5XS49_PARAH|nr:PIN domain-containing protein [Paracoccus aminophilus]AGT07947.1 hypothetical protein JCM7686_0838 [Paracoccus aminophilus JCM 7686]